MKRFNTKKVISLILMLTLLCSVSACGKKKEAETSETTEETSVSIVETTVATTTTLLEYAGPLPSTDVEITWTETELEQQTVRYAAVTAGEFLRVRKGPGVEYDIVGTLTRNQEVVVVAVTSSGWYKTSDGFYISGDFLVNAPM